MSASDTTGARWVLLALALALALAVSGLGRSSRASAQATDAEAIAQARSHFELGVQLIEQGRWQQAVLELQAAQRIHPTAPVLYNLGIAERGLGHPRAAIDAFRAFLDLLGEDAPARRRSEVDGYIAELDGELAELRLVLAPAGARVFVDDVEESPSEGRLRLDPAAHAVRIEADGYETATRSVTLERAGRATLDVTLAATVTDGRLLVESATVGAVITLDGQIVGGAPYDGRLAPGTHQVLVRAPGHGELRRSITIEVGADVRVEADLQAEDELVSSPWLWIGVSAVVAGGVTLGALAAAGVFTSAQPPIVGDLGIVTGALELRL